MPSKSQKQARFMAAAAHNPKFAKRAGIKPGVARDFNRADTGTKMLSTAMRKKKYANGGLAAARRFAKPMPGGGAFGGRDPRAMPPVTSGGRAGPVDPNPMLGGMGQPPKSPYTPAQPMSPSAGPIDPNPMLGGLGGPPVGKPGAPMPATIAPPAGPVTPNPMLGGLGQASKSPYDPVSVAPPQTQPFDPNPMLGGMGTPPKSPYISGTTVPDLTLPVTPDPMLGGMGPPSKSPYDPISIGPPAATQPFDPNPMLGGLGGPPPGKGPQPMVPPSFPSGAQPGGQPPWGARPNIGGLAQYGRAGGFPGGFRGRQPFPGGRPGGRGGIPGGIAPNALLRTAGGDSGMGGSRLDQLMGGMRQRYAKGGSVKKAVAALDRARSMLEDSDPNFDQIATLLARDVPAASGIAGRIRRTAKAKPKTDNPDEFRAAWQAIAKDIRTLKSSLGSE